MAGTGLRVLLNTAGFLGFAGHLFCCPCSPLGCSGGAPGWLVILLGPGTREVGACQSAPSRKAAVKKTLLWALKSELQPVPAEGCDSHLLLWSCHLNNDSVVWFEGTGSRGKEKCLSGLGLGSGREQPRPSAFPKPSPQYPQLDLFGGDTCASQIFSFGKLSLAGPSGHASAPLKLCLIKESWELKKESRRRGTGRGLLRVVLFPN